LQSALLIGPRCNSSTTFTVRSQRNLPRGTSPAGRLDPAGGRGSSCPAGASKFPDLGAGLVARSDRDPGWSPWPTPCIQTRTIASTAPGRQACPATYQPVAWLAQLPAEPTACKPDRPRAFWRHRSQHPAGPTQAARGRDRRPPTTWPACRLTWRASAGATTAAAGARPQGRP
jgi:hypothetical protein